MLVRTSPLLIGCLLVLALSGAGVLCAFDGWESGIDWPEPPVVTPGAQNSPPSDAIVLFDGTNLDAWNNVKNWKIVDGYGIAGSGISTKQKFGDCQLHLEFATPPKVTSSGQGRGNNGVSLMGRYEVQILDSYENPTYFDGQCGAIYKQHPPLVNVCRPPGEWQTYDIFFTAPRFNEDGTLRSPGFVTVVHNGVLIQNHFQLLGKTDWNEPPKYEPHPLREPLTLAYHRNPVRFRNIWIRDLLPPEDDRPSDSKSE